MLGAAEDRLVAEHLLPVRPSESRRHGEDMPTQAWAWHPAGNRGACPRFRRTLCTATTEWSKQLGRCIASEKHAMRSCRQECAKAWPLGASTARESRGQL
jgi:hypothetical protein